MKRVRACKVTEYYEILSVKRDCEEVEIKKAYRKVRTLSGGGRDVEGADRVVCAAGVVLAPRQEWGTGC